MAHVYHRCFYHFVWSVKERMPLIDELAREPLIKSIFVACHERSIEVLACNAMPDHVHLLVQLPPSQTPATFIGQIKGASAFEHNKRFGQRSVLKWQDGYGVVTIREAEIEKIVRYIENQQELHEKRKLSRLLETMSDESQNAHR